MCVARRGCAPGRPDARSRHAPGPAPRCPQGRQAALGRAAPRRRGCAPVTRAGTEQGIGAAGFGCRAAGRAYRRGGERRLPASRAARGRPDADVLPADGPSRAGEPPGAPGALHRYGLVVAYRWTVRRAGCAHRGRHPAGHVPRGCVPSRRRGRPSSCRGRVRCGCRAGAKDPRPPAVRRAGPGPTAHPAGSGAGRIGPGTDHTWPGAGRVGPAGTAGRIAPGAARSRSCAGRFTGPREVSGNIREADSGRPATVRRLPATLGRPEAAGRSGR